MNKFDEAMTDYSRAIELTPKEEVFLYHRGMLRFKLNMDQLAVQVFMK
jgi:hypothetical protein